MFYPKQTDYIDKLNTVAAEQRPVTVAATVGGTTTLDCSSGGTFFVNMGAGNTTIAISNVPTATKLTIFIKQDGTGSRTVTWPAGTVWPTSGSTLTTTANRTDLITFTTIDSGTKWYGRIEERNYQ